MWNKDERDVATIHSVAKTSQEQLENQLVWIWHKLNSVRQARVNMLSNFECQEWLWKCILVSLCVWNWLIRRLGWRRNIVFVNLNIVVSTQSCNWSRRLKSEHLRSKYRKKWRWFFGCTILYIFVSRINFILLLQIKAIWSSRDLTHMVVNQHCTLHTLIRVEQIWSTRFIHKLRWSQFLSEIALWLSCCCVYCTFRTRILSSKFMT